MGIVVRAETPGDCRAVAELHIRAWQVAYTGIVPAGILAALDADARTQARLDRLADPEIPFRNLVALDGDTVTGFVCFGPYRAQELDGTPLQPQHGEILAIYVHPDRWGTGVGDALLLAALAALPQPEVRLWALAENHRALRFYARHGLHPDGARATYRPTGSDVDIPELRLTLRREVPA
ncbi:GNAT family N-acetyltransferase [Catellatospora bangladeshensis]|uniref:N-acetyltransferase n=1 Tax=Catellatospora bangladeshensis TaxID=310355 RepID=A0A8J3JJA6_9ACTN|nr:GNAT family N-acetyltransferase [Catellatospora bangladeshensis]GIF85791.1 N-acetyltransferase [Catellatospora bangladeshensis]